MNLRDYIANGGLTITQIGQHLGVSEHGVRKWVYGQRQPDIDTALAIEKLTDGKVTVADFARERPEGEAA